MKILLYDLETAPNKAYVWGKYEQDVIAFIEEGYLLSFSAKWFNGKQITKGLCDYKSSGDKELVKELHDLMNEADIVVAHNGDRFDIRKMNTRFIYHGFSPPDPYKTVDTLKVARKYFAFNSNKLDDLGNFLNVGRKVKHPGFDLWLGCMSGDQKSWDLMKKYNKQDVLLLEQIYLKLRGWMTNHPSVAENGCPTCGSKDSYKRGVGRSKRFEFQKYSCKNCGKNYQERI